MRVGAYDNKSAIIGKNKQYADMLSFKGWQFLTAQSRPLTHQQSCFLKTKYQCLFSFGRNLERNFTTMHFTQSQEYNTVVPAY